MSEITGFLIVKNETKEYGSNNFRKREFVIKTEDSQYPQELSIDLLQDKCALIDNHNIGDKLKIAYNLNGRSWTNPEGETKYFNSIVCWRIENLEQGNTPSPQLSQSDNFEPTNDYNEEEDSDLPFG